MYEEEYFEEYVPIPEAMKAERFKAKLKCLCHEKNAKVKDIEAFCGVCQGYFSRLLHPSQYDIAKVCKFFGITEEKFRKKKPYEIIKTKDLTFAENNYTAEEWEIIKRAIAREKAKCKTNKSRSTSKEGQTSKDIATNPIASSSTTEGFTKTDVPFSTGFTRLGLSASFTKGEETSNGILQGQ